MQKLTQLKLLNVKIKYSSKEDNLLEDFLIPCLGVSVRYDRITGYFSSKLFPLTFVGLQKFIQNNGKMRLLVGWLPSEDIKVLNKDKMELSKLWEDNFNNFLSEQVLKKANSHLRILAYMLAHDQIEIKLGLLLKEKYNKNSEQFSIHENLIEKGILHEKVGLFYDTYGNSISFSGSINETLHGWTVNLEEFSTYNNWEEKIFNYWQYDKEKFIQYWNNQSNYLSILEFPISSKKILSQICPETFQRVQEECRKTNQQYIPNFSQTPQSQHERNIFSIIRKEKIGLILDKKNEKPLIALLNMRDYQKEALIKLKERKWKGILNMATGTGKTKTSLKALYYIWKDLQNQKFEPRMKENRNIHSLLTVIAVPGKTLVRQWHTELIQYFEFVIKIDGDSYNETELHEFLVFIKQFPSSIGIIIISSASIDKLLREPCFPGTSSMLLIADEVHHTGAPKIQTQLKKIDPNYRLGLSATPIRHFDKEGTDFILSYFGRTAFRYALKDAIEAGYLVPYTYHYEICHLTEQEYAYYQKLTRQISIKKKMNKSELMSNDEEIKELLLIRARILKKAENKVDIFKNYLLRLRYKGLDKNIVVFLEDYEQNEQFLEVARNLNYRTKCYGAETPSLERINIIKELEQKKIDMVLTKKCWDQGIDIPFLETGIIISSSTNPLQYIQRIGRLLRLFPEKKQVYVYDVLIAPPNNSNEYSSLKCLFASELARMNYLIKNANNFEFFKAAMDDL